jgi:hypothetical protein
MVYKIYIFIFIYLNCIQNLYIYFYIFIWHKIQAPGNYPEESVQGPSFFELLLLNDILRCGAQSSAGPLNHTGCDICIVIIPPKPVWYEL